MIPFGMMTATTDHGGTVMATQQQAVVNGIAFLRAGDGFVCPKCKVWSTLVISNQNIIMFGKPVAFAGDKFTCGATLMPSQSLVGGDKEQSSASQSLDKQSQQDSSYDEHFILHDQATGEAITGFAYGIETALGVHHDKVCDNGKTKKITSKSPVPVKLLYVIQTEIGMRK